MNIAVFADVHGRVLLAFMLCARWQRETGERIDLILQAGDLGAFFAAERLDKATRRYAERDPTELGFLTQFVEPQPQVAAILEQTTCPMVFVRGNHEDHVWLDMLETQNEGALFPVDAYKRVHLLKTGLPWTFQKDGAQISLVGVGRVGAKEGEEEPLQAKYIQDYELERLYELEHEGFDVLLAHDTRPDSVVLERGDYIRTGGRIKEIGYLLDQDRPAYHFFGHYGGPALIKTDSNGITRSVKLADLHWQGESNILEAGSMGILRWQDREHHSFTILDYPWLKEYTAQTWRYLA